MTDDAAELVAAVTRAIEEGSSVRVRYFAGSSPGAERVLSPITLTDVHITAKPAGQYQAKRYLLAELELVVDGKPSARPPVRPPVIFSDMASLGEHITNLLGGLGWHVAATPSDITVHRRRKNGTPLKGAELVMSF
ncbi:MAG TPA: hypothetical protein PKN64_16550, partial [Casimicrobium sp.]|nr:hypothetical protein [Casimicrobium sp.]